MSRQLSIRSDEADRLAASLAKRLGVSTTKVVETALRELDRLTPAGNPPQLTPEQEAEHQAFLAFLRENDGYVLPGATSDHRGMYDENGLPL